MIGELSRFELAERAEHGRAVAIKLSCYRIVIEAGILQLPDSLNVHTRRPAWTGNVTSGGLGALDAGPKYLFLAHSHRGIAVVAGPKDRQRRALGVYPSSQSPQIVNGAGQMRCRNDDQRVTGAKCSDKPLEYGTRLVFHVSKSSIGDARAFQGVPIRSPPRREIEFVVNGLPLIELQVLVWEERSVDI